MAEQTVETPQQDQSIAELSSVTPPTIDAKKPLTVKDITSFQTPYLTQKANLAEKNVAALGEVESAKQRQSELEAQAGLTGAQMEASGARAALDKYHKGMEENPLPAFVPSKENAQDMAILFGLVNTMGMLIGGRGKQNAQLSMAAMNGMLEGHNKGREDIYKKEKDEFERNFKAMQAKHAELRQEMMDAVKLSATDARAGQQAAHMAAVKSGSDIVKALTNQGRIVEAAKLIDESQKGMNEALKFVEKEQDREKQFQQQKKLKEIEHANALEREKIRTQAQLGKGEIFQGKDGAMYRVTPDNKVVKIEGSEGFSKLPSASKPTPSLGSTAFLNSVIGASSGNEKTDKSIVDAAQGVNQLGQVINLFKDPDVKTGVIAKLAPIREKMASIGDNNHEITDDEMRRIIDGEISPTAKNAVAQKEALFAAYTAEREIAGGRLLVSIVKQAGGALDPTNYEKQGYLNLLNSRQEELRSRLRGARLDDDQIDDVVHALKTQKRKSVSEPQQTSPGFNVPSVSDIDAELARRGIK
jgi:hypothetical protein